MKRLTRPEPVSGEALRVGEELRDTRMALGVSLEEVAASLRIRRAYLTALEEGRVQDLPAPAYAIGFVRSYARALGLDADSMVRRFREGSDSVVRRRTDLVFPEPVPERGVPAGAVMLVGAVLAVGAYVGWYNWSGSGDRTVDAVPPLSPGFERAASRAAAPVAPFGSEPIAAATTRPAILGTPGVSVPRAAPPTPTAAAAATAPSAALPELPAPSVTSEPAPARPAAVAPEPAVPPQAQPASDGLILLRARSADVWIQVRERPGGPVLVDRVLRPGESWEVPAREGLVMATGNAAELEIVVAGEALGLGPGGLVRRNIPLDAKQLRAELPRESPPGGASAAAAADPAHPSTP